MIIVLFTLALRKAIKNPATDWRLLRVVIAFIGNTMERIINGTRFESKPADFVRVIATTTHTGHIEMSAYRPHLWHEAGEALAYDHHLHGKGYCASYIASEQQRLQEQMLRDAEQRADEIAEMHAKQSAQRAKKASRLACKSIGADCLMTLTYRENMRDLPACKKHLKEFARRVTRVWPEFQAVCAFEQQKRGAWHVHLATQKVPERLQRNAVKVKSFDVLRAIWRSVTGPLGGNVDVRNKARNSQKSPARIAAYLSKYITKAFERGEKFTNRWTKFGSIKQPVRTPMGDWATMGDAMAAMYGSILETQVIVTTFIRAGGGVFWLAAEERPK